MRKLFVRSIITISIITAILVPLSTWSCGPELASDAARISLFSTRLAGDGVLNAFNYTPQYLHSYTDSIASADLERNCNEWRLFTDSKATTEDIYALQYETDADSFLNDYEHSNWQQYKQNTFMQWLLKKKHRKALDYFVFAKQLEFQQSPSDAWDTTRIEPEYDSLARYAYSKANQKLPTFLKERYAFQAVKSFYYSKYYPSLSWDFTSPELIQCYDQYLKNKPSIVADWALLYYAMAQPDTAQKTLNLIRCFDRCEDKKVYIYQFLDLPALQGAEAAAKDKNDKVLVHCIGAILTPGRALDELKYIYDNDPCNKYLPLLITREVSKLDDWIWSPEVLGFHSLLKDNLYEHERYEQNKEQNTNDTPYAYYAQKNITKDRAYLADVRQQLTAMTGNCSYTNLLNLSIAHLYNIEGKGIKANEYLSKVNSDGHSVHIQRQSAIESFISLTSTEDITTEATKTALAEAVQKLEATGLQIAASNPWDGGANYESDNDLAELLVYLGRRYEQKHDVVTAGLLLQKAGIQINEYGYDCKDSVCYGAISYFEKHARPSDIEKLITLKHKINKTAFEDVLTPNLWAADNLLLDLEGTLYIRAEQYTKALSIMNKIPDNYWQDNYEYKNNLPLSSITKLGTLLPVASGNGRNYKTCSKKLIIKEIVDLQQDVITKKGLAKANACFMLANAYYNITYYGKAWMMTAYGRSAAGGTYDMWSDNYNWVYYTLYNGNNHCLKNYYGCAAALDMYQKALAAAKGDKELSAKCLVMLAYCDKLAHTNYDSKEEQMKPYDYAGTLEEYKSPYLSRLRKQFKSTETYSLSKGYCPDIN